MAIQWFPGHMHKAIKAMRQQLSTVDVLLEVIDSRCPASSQNPVINEWLEHKPSLKLLNKVDLAGSEATQHWLHHINQQANTRALALQANVLTPSMQTQILRHCRELTNTPSSYAKPLCIAVVGIPNVGKSTLINQWLGRNIANTGNEPAITKQQQLIRLQAPQDDVVLLDNPGMLWSKFLTEHIGYRLAITGAIRETAMDYQEVAFYLLDYLLAQHPDALTQRYGATVTQATTIEQSFTELVQHIGATNAQHRHKQWQKAAVQLVHDFRQQRLGNITLETPAMVTQEADEAYRQHALIQERKKMRKQAFVNRKKIQKT